MSIGGNRVEFRARCVLAAIALSMMGGALPVSAQTWPPSFYATKATYDDPTGYPAAFASTDLSAEIAGLEHATISEGFCVCG
ncbi:MAG: hypothetical protein JJ992_12480 [Planctomycetes bacterium]|nr:hypothetical protein [Planctomycetota bacterium]